VAVELLNVPVTVAAAVSFTVQEPVPEQAPDQPANVEPLAGAALRVMEVPSLKLALHVFPQLMPVGLLVIVPEPVPADSTVSM